jgi:hypothetical protein
MLFFPKVEINPVIYDNMSEPGGCQANHNKSDIENKYFIMILYVEFKKC